MRWNRRDFLKIVGAGAAAPLLPFGRETRTAARGEALAPPRRSLVVIELTGGNDALSTFVPVHDAVYRDRRKRTAYEERGVIRLADDVFMAPALEPWKDIYASGRLAFVEAVGYETPNRSHFGSMDTWHQAEVPPGVVRSGWIGRMRAAEVKRDPSIDRPLFCLGPGAAPLAFAGAPEAPFCISAQKKMRVLQKAPAMTEPSGTARADDLLFLDAEARALEKVGAALEVAGKRKPLVEYPKSGLAAELALLAGLLTTGFDRAVYFTRFDGFDTHAAQKDVHPLLLDQLARATRSFIDDLTKAGAADDVLVMVFSEFGRRVAENGSGGTDHGAGGTMIFFGGGLSPGRIGAPADLKNLIDGDIRPAVDFRGVYAQVLDRHLGIPEAAAITHAPIGGAPPIFRLR